ncbi:class I SAM-dependent methyltransferase [Blastococcus sp. SYSU D00820]
MPRMLRARAAWEVVRSGDLRGRVRATRDGQAAVRLHQVAAGLSTGVLDALAAGTASTAELATRCRWTDADLAAAFLRGLAAAGVVAADGDRWRLTARGRAVVGDDLVRASHEAFAGFHTDLYRGLPALLAGGPRRRDVVEHGGVIARVSAAFEPLVSAVLTRTVTELRPRRVLDVGCGAGLQLAMALEAAPDDAVGIGVETDADAAALAERTLAGRGLAGRATVLRADVRAALTDPAGPLAEPVDLVLLANVVYYLPVGERVALLRDLAGALAPGGALLVVTTAADPSAVSRHFDLLLRAQEGAMELPDAGGLARQMEEAGLGDVRTERLAPGAPLIAVTGRRA